LKCEYYAYFYIYRQSKGISVSLALVSSLFIKIRIKRFNNNDELLLVILKQSVIHISVLFLVL